MDGHQQRLAPIGEAGQAGAHQRRPVHVEGTLCRLGQLVELAKILDGRLAQAESRLWADHLIEVAADHGETGAQGLVSLEEPVERRGAGVDARDHPGKGLLGLEIPVTEGIASRVHEPHRLVLGRDQRLAR